MFSILLSKVSHLLRFIVFVQPETPVRARSARQTAQNSVGMRENHGHPARRSRCKFERFFTTKNTKSAKMPPIYD